MQTTTAFSNEKITSNLLEARFLLSREGMLFLRRNVKNTMVWPAASLACLTFLIALLLSLLQKTRHELEEKALIEAASLSDTYALEIGRAIGELDHVTALLKSNWENSNGSFRLDDINKDDTFVDTTLVSISFINREGLIVSSTLPGAVGMAVTDRSYFAFHRENRSRDLLIGPPVQGRLRDKEIVTYTRRLSLKNGDFDGVVSASTGTRFLAPFANQSTMGATGVLALVGTDGILRAGKIGSQVESILDPKVIKQPILDSNASFITGRWSDWFRDNEVRYIGAKTVPGYPLHTVVGLGQTDVLMAYHDAKAAYIKIGLSGAIVLALFGFVGFALSVRLEWRKHNDAAVKQAYRMATENANEGFFMWRQLTCNAKEKYDFELIDCNERGAELYGRTRSEILGIRHGALHAGQALDRVNALIATVMELGYYEDEFKRLSGGTVEAEWIYRKIVRVEAGIIVTLRDISEGKKLEKEKSELAERDSLTKLPNRHWLTNNLPAALERATMDGQSIAILFIDLDKFKNINDTWGHSTGDKLLYLASVRIQSVLRAGDAVARFGGDEFIALLEGLGDEGSAAEVVHRIQKALERPFEIMEREFNIGASIGISMFPKDGTDEETLIRNADIAMYAAKKETKSRHRFFEQKLFTYIKAQTELERNLSIAIERDQFIVHYQPRFNSNSRLPVGMEALVRWEHPENGIIYPSAFIGVAEGSNLIVQLGEMVMDKVCFQVAAWRSQGLDTLPVSINVSAKQFNEERVSTVLESTLRRYSLPPSSIEIELTESIMVSHSEQVFNELSAIRALGVSVHLDDFGTGYSSLSVLHKLELDVLKVDKSFTAQLGENKEGEIFFRAIISMAKALDMRVIAEGVETAEQLRVLQVLECDEIQGYVFSRPLPAEEVVKYMMEHVDVDTA